MYTKLGINSIRAKKPSFADCFAIVRKNNAKWLVGEKL